MSLPPSSVPFPRCLEGRYRPLRELGRGGMGAVFLAQDSELQRDVAIKTLLQPSPETRARFLREAQLQARVQHPHIVEIYEWGGDEGEAYLVMEALEGRSLEGPLGDFSPIQIVRPIAQALETLHRAGLIHRDVKPANLFLTSLGRVVLTDFGVAYDSELDRLTRTGVVVGTVRYMSPELLRDREPTFAMDWWALGVTLFVLVEGKVPYEFPQLLAASKGLPLSPPPYEVLKDGSELRSIVSALLAENPADRPTSWREIEEAGAGRRGYPRREEEPRRATEGVPATSPLRVQATKPEGAWRSKLGKLLYAVPLGLVMLLAWRLPRRWEQRVSPRPLPGPEISEEANLFPDLKEKVRREFLRLEGLRFDPEGRLTRETGDPGHSQWPLLMNPDPLFYGEIPNHLPSLQGALTWFHQRTSWEDLSPASLASLRETDEFLTGQGLDRAFVLLLDSGPLVGEHPELARSWSSDPPPFTHGWLGRSLQAFHRFESIEEGLHQSWQRGGEGDSLFPIKLQEFTSLRTYRFLTATKFARDLPDCRLDYHHWSKRASRETMVWLLAASRSLRHEPEAREWLRSRLDRIFSRLGHWFPLSRVASSTASILGGEPRLWEQKYLQCLVLWVKEEFERHRIRGSLPAGENVPNLLLELVQQAEANSDDRHQLALARYRKVVYWVHSRHHSKIIGYFIEQGRNLLEDLPDWHRRQFLYRVLRAWAEPEALPAPRATDFENLRALIQEVPEELDPGDLRIYLAKLQLARGAE